MTEKWLELEKLWNDQEPTCGTCGWANAYYEIADVLRPTDTVGEYWAPCRNKDDEDSWSHRGYYLYDAQRFISLSSDELKEFLRNKRCEELSLLSATNAKSPKESDSSPESQDSTSSLVPAPLSPCVNTRPT